MSETWAALPAWAQDLTLAALWVSPLVLGALFCARYRVIAPVVALLRRHRAVAVTVVGLIALSVALGYAVIVQERSVREGSARAANAFGLVVAAPGSEVEVLLATVFLQPSSLALLPATTLTEIAAREDVALAAPIALGDSVQGRPVVGTTAAFVHHLIDTTAPDARLPVRFDSREAAWAGARTPFAIGAVLEPAHGFDHGDRHAQTMTVTTRLPPTGTPWDDAVIVPVEAVWSAHGLGDGHASDRSAIGPPFDAERMPGVPAIVVVGRNLAAHYAVRGAFDNARSMALFPGEVLLRLHGLLGDLVRGISLISAVSRTLVVIALVACLVVLMRGFAGRFAMLLALGAPRRYVFAVVWVWSCALITLGGMLGLPIGRLAALALSHWLSMRTAVALVPRFEVQDLIGIAVFVGIGALLAVIPAIVVARLDPIRALRG